MPAGREPLALSEPLHCLQARKESCAILHCSRIFLLIKALSDSKPFPKGEGRSHLPRSEASNLNGVEIHLNESHNRIPKHTYEGKHYALFLLHKFAFYGPCEGSV